MDSVWPANRATGLSLLKAFVPQAGRDYARLRNYDFGPERRGNVSCLSPYIRHRLITEEDAVRAVLALQPYQAAQSFVSEVLWRTYWKGWLAMRPEVWSRYLADTRAISEHLESDVQLCNRVRRAEAGETGIVCFDAWAKELSATGYLHNHARMWFASIWIFTLRLPWQRGAEFFMRHLLDGDAASNTLSWRWVAGLHTQGKTYLARASNIEEFTDGCFKSTQGLATEALPLTEANPPGRAKPLERRPSSCSGRVVLLVTEDDLNPESWETSGADVCGVIVLDTATGDDRLALRVQGFKAEALKDAGERAKSYFGCTVAILGASGTEVCQNLITFSKDNSGASLVVSDPREGFATERLLPILSEARANGLDVQILRRQWDQLFFPVATAGFFKVKAEIPATLRALGIPA